MANTKELNIRLQTAKRLITNLIVKQSKRALENETEESIRNYVEYYNAFMKLDKLSDYPKWTKQEIKDALIGITDDDANMLSEDNIVVELYKQGNFNDHEIERLLDTKRAYIITNYVETNEYYRMLVGLPTLE